MCHDSGAVTFRLTDGHTLPFDDGELDAIYCISVLEHIERPDDTVLEMARVLRPNGRLIVTFDLDMNGKHEIGPVGYRRLRTALCQSFELAVPEVTIHPGDQLNTTNSPYPLFSPTGLAREWYKFKQSLKPFLGRKPDQLLDYDLRVAGFSLRKTQKSQS
jgi:SAM-dependent methyltransferase